MSSKQIDKKLIQDLIKGDPFAFDEIYKLYSKKIYLLSLSYLKNKQDAEGVVQEVFLNLWRKRHDTKDQFSFDSYLFTITYNTIRNRFRKLSRDRNHQEVYGTTISLEDYSTSTEIEYKNMMEQAEIAINRLPERQKAVYFLNMREGLTTEEISKRLGISKRTVENHLHRAKTYLKKALSDNRLISILYILLFIQ